MTEVTKQVQGALEALASLQQAMLDAGGGFGTPELLKKPLGEVLEILGINGVRFHYEKTAERLQREAAEIPSPPKRKVGDKDKLRLEATIVVAYQRYVGHAGQPEMQTLADDLKAKLQEQLVQAAYVNRRPQDVRSGRSNDVIANVISCDVDVAVPPTEKS